LGLAANDQRGIGLLEHYRREVAKSAVASQALEERQLIASARREG
jgi:hypothetical protein